METKKKIQLGKHSISYGKTSKKFLDKAGAGIAKLAVKLFIFYFIYLQLLTIWGVEATFLLLIFFMGYNIADGMGEIKKIREQLEKLTEPEKKPEEKPEKKPIWKE